MGTLEQVAAQLSALQGSLTPDASKARTVLFAGDHGVVAEGISAYPQEVTRQMGVAGDAVEGVLDYKIADGTQNFAQSPAMSETQLQQALKAGEEAIDRAHADNISIVAIGEMGIGNTTSAAAIVSAICNAPASVTVGRGTGLDDAGVVHKQNIVEQSLDRHDDRTPEKVLQNLGGFEIAAMCGAMLKSCDFPIVIVVDGYIATAAALCAVAINPQVLLLQLGLRLGEGSGAALAIPLIRSAAALLTDMATFESAGVAREIS